MNSTTLRQVESLFDKLTLNEQAALIERLARRMRLATSCISIQPQDLYGIWKGKFPKNADLDMALHEIRQGWEIEWNEGGEFVE